MKNTNLKERLEKVNWKRVGIDVLIGTVSFAAGYGIAKHTSGISIETSTEYSENLEVPEVSVTDSVTTE